MTLTKIQLSIIGLVLFTLFAAYFVFSNANQAVGEAFTGQISRIDSATTTTVGPDGVSGGNAVTIFSKGTECDARIITTRGDSAIMISFGEIIGKETAEISSSTLSGTIGHLQLASTTVVYDSGLYGCGVWSAYAWSSTTLTVSEL